MALRHMFVWRVDILLNNFFLKGESNTKKSWDKNVSNTDCKFSTLDYKHKNVFLLLSSSISINFCKSVLKFFENNLENLR